MEREASIAVHTIAAAAAALCCSYSLQWLVRPGGRRLVALLPVFTLLFHLPFQFTTFHLRYFAAFLSWLTSFKLLSFAFGNGQLSDPLLPLRSFVILASFPICTVPRNKPHEAKRVSLPPFILLTGKLVLFAYLVNYYPIRHLHPRYHFVFLVGVHLYFSLDISFVVLARVARFLLGDKVVLEPQFWAPYFTTSPQDFWSRRWNMPVSRALHSLVYSPVRARLGVRAGVLATFLVSGGMHEAMFYCATRERQIGVATCFFLLQGLLVSAEIEAKARGWRSPPRLVMTPLTLAVVWSTSSWLQFPQLIKGRGEEAAVAESVAVLKAAGDALARIFGVPSLSRPQWKGVTN